jgi:hypothetical protein
LTNEIRKAGNENNLAETQGHIDDILKGELEKYAMGNTEAAETAALGLATHRLGGTQKCDRLQRPGRANP